MNISFGADPGAFGERQDIRRQNRRSRRGPRTCKLHTEKPLALKDSASHSLDSERFVNSLTGVKMSMPVSKTEF